MLPQDPPPEGAPAVRPVLPLPDRLRALQQPGQPGVGVRRGDPQEAPPERLPGREGRPQGREAPLVAAQSKASL